MFDKAKQLWEMQKKGKALQKELKETEIEAKSNDGKVVVVISGELHLLSVEIDESLLSPAEKRELESKLKTTLTEALSRAQALAADKSREMMKDLGIDLPGM